MSHPSIRVESFIIKYDRFRSEMESLIKVRSTFQANTNADYEMSIWKFKKTAEQDIDKCWQNLTADEKLIAGKIVTDKYPSKKG